MATEVERLSHQAVVIQALVGVLADNSSAVREASTLSLLKDAEGDANVVIECCITSLRTVKRRGAQAASHRSSVLNVMAKTIRVMDKRNMTEDFVRRMMAIAMTEMANSKDSDIIWLQSASSLLVSLNCHMPNLVMEEIFHQLTGSTVPVIALVQSLAEFASVDAFKFVPYMKGVLSRVLPLLGGIKDVQKQAFADAFVSWCEAMTVYYEEYPSAPYLGPDMQALLHSAFDLFLGRWIYSRDHRVCLATVEALAQMLPLINRLQLKSAIPKLVPAILAVYKKEKKNRFPVTYGLHMLLRVALPTADPMLEFQALTPMLNALSPMASIYSSKEHGLEDATILKNFNEVIRCFVLIATSYPEDLFNYILPRLSAKEMQTRLGAILILKHLLTRLSDIWVSKLSGLLDALKALMQEQDLNLRKALSELVVTLASIGYLHPENGKPFIMFLIKQSSIADEDVEVFRVQQEAVERAIGAYSNLHYPDTLQLKMGVVSPSELRAVCDKCLYLLSSTAPKAEPLLYPYLLKVLTPKCYTEAVATVCKCLSEILKRRAASGEPIIIDYSLDRDVPRPEEILARLLILLQNPLARNHLTSRILKALFYLAPLFPTSVQLLWEDEIPKLKAYVSDTEDMMEDSSQQATWEEMILHLLTESVDVIQSSEWTMSLADALIHNYDLHSGDHQHSALLHRCLGVVLAKVDNRNFAREKIAVMYKKADITDPTNRRGLAMGMGLVAASHVDTVLEKLKLVLEKESKGSISRFISSMFERGGKDIDNVFAALALMYGYTASYAPSTVIEARIDKLVGTNVLSRLLDVKSASAKQAVITAINLLGQAVIKASANGVPFPLKRRDTMLDYIITLMVTQGSNSILGFSNSLEEDTLFTQKLAINACTTLVSVEPKLTPTARDRILEATLGFYTLPTEPALIVNSVLSDLTDLLCIILRTSGENGKSRADQVNHLLNSLDQYISSPVQHQRERAAISLLAILREFQTFCTAGAPLLPSRDALNLGKRIVMYIPRCADVSPLIRKSSAQILDLLFSISLMLPKDVGSTSTENRQAFYTALSSLEELIATSKWDSMAELAGTQQIVDSISVLLTDQEYVSALQSCNVAICDIIPQCGEGATVAIRQLILKRASQLQETDVAKITQSLFLAASAIDGLSRRQKVLEAVCSLAQETQARVVMTELLTAAGKEAQSKVAVRHKGAWPVEQAFTAFANHVDLALPFLHYLISVLDQTPVLKDDFNKAENSSLMQTTHTIDYFPVAAIRALATIFRVGGDPIRKALEQCYPRVFCTLLLQIGGSHGATGLDTRASRDIILAFQAFCRFSGNVDMENVVQCSVEKLLSEGDWIDAVGRIAYCVALTHPKQVGEICNLLRPALKRNYVYQRITAVAALSECVKTSKGPNDLLVQLVGILSGHIGDESPVVRRLCVKGLVQVPQEEMVQYVPQILSVIVTLTDDAVEDVAYSAVRGLPTVLEIATEEAVAPVLLNLCVRLRSLQAKDSDRMRASSFLALEKLSSFATGPQLDGFLEQVHAILPRLILHMNDDAAIVRQACKTTFKTIASLLHAEGLKLLQKPNIFESDHRWDYDGFLREFSQHLVRHFPDRMDTYLSSAIQAFDSQWPNVQANAIYFVASVLSQLDDQRSSSIYVPQVVTLLLGILTSSPAPGVRARAALALGILLGKVRTSSSFSGDLVV